MQGTSRDSLAALREQLPQRGADAALSGDLLAVAALLGRERSLLGALTDPGAAPGARAELADNLLRGRIGESSRWSRGRDLADALETLGALAGFAAAERAGTLDSVEDELFRFGRTLDAQPEE